MRAIRLLAALVCLAGLTACQSTIAGTARPTETPAQLAFRKVLTAEPAQGRPEPAPRDAAAAKAARQDPAVADPAAARPVLDALDCSVPDPLRGKDDPALPLVTCDPREGTRYVLERAFLTGSEVRSAKAEPDQGGSGGWQITLTFTDTGTRIWGEFTTSNTGQQVAVVVDSQVVSAPTIATAILGGSTTISGRFTKEQAEQLAAQLGSR